MFKATPKDTRRSDYAVWVHHSRDYLERLIEEAWDENLEHWDIVELDIEEL